MLVGTREGTRVRENVRECGQTGLDKGDTWPDLKAHSGTRWKQNSRCGSPVAWGNPLCLLRTPMDGQGPLADSPGGRRALLNPAPSVNRIPLGTIPADLSPRSSHMGRQAAPLGVSRPAPTLATTPRIRLPASASQGVTTMTASPAGRRSGRVSAPGLRAGGGERRRLGTQSGETDAQSHTAEPEPAPQAPSGRSHPRRLGPRTQSRPGLGGGTQAAGAPVPAPGAIEQGEQVLRKHPVMQRALRGGGREVRGGQAPPARSGCTPEK